MSKIQTHPFLNSTCDAMSKMKNKEKEMKIVMISIFRKKKIK